MLERVRVDHGDEANIVSADLVRTGGVAGFFARETFRVVVELNDEPAPVPLRAADPAARLVRPVPRGSGSDFADLLGQMIDLSYADADIVETTPEPDAEIAAVGPSAGPAGEPLALAELLGRLETLVRPAPPVPSSGIVAVVGRRVEVGAAASTVAAACGVATAEVLLAAPGHHLATPTRVAGIARSLARRADDRPVVVAVVIEGGIDGCRWAGEVLAALRADQVRLAVGGWRRVDDATDLLSLLSSSGPVDVVDLVGVAEAADPDAFLTLDAPVGTLDGEPADLDRWVELIVDARRHLPGVDLVGR